MKGFLKTILTTSAMVIILSVCCTIQAFALTDGDWEFQLLDNEVAITDYNGTETDIVIPDTIYGRPVTQVISDERDYSFLINYYFNNAVTLTFPKTVKIVENGLLNSFAGNKTLKTVILPEGVEEIEDRAFERCENLENIVFPSTLKRIGDHAFQDCHSLTQITFPAEMEVIAHSAFEGCSSLQSVEIPDNVTQIRECAFAGCTSLTQIILPVSLKGLGHQSFATTGLTEVVIPYGTENIGSEVFASCENLKSLYIPDTVKNMWSDVIHGSNNCIIYCSSESEAAKTCKKYQLSYLTDNSVNSGITVLYNGTRISFHAYGQNPELLNNRTLVPLRSIFEAMGAKVEWDDSTNTAVAKRNGIEARIQIGANKMYVNGKTKPVDVPAQLLNDRTMVPVRIIAEAFGADVQWNDSGRTVLINE